VKISETIMEINDLRGRFAGPCHPAFSPLALILTFSAWAREQPSRGRLDSSACKKYALERFTNPHYHTSVGTQSST